MRWLRLDTQPIFISNQCYIYKRRLTTFICCGCAYGHVPTTLWLLMPIYGTFLNFVRNLGYSQAISDGEMRWLRGCTPSPYSSHINVIYIKGVWQPLYAVDVHMDVSPPRYGCSCRPSFDCQQNECPKRVGSFGSSTDFLIKRKLVGSDMFR